MKSNKWLLSLAVGFLCCGSAYSQTTVKGTITSESGEPLIGATITVKNSTDGTVTDIDGNYSLKTKKTLSSKDLLLFSYVGYKTLQKNYTGNTMNVKLAEESQQLNDVVVTALGIKRGEKGLGYATETVKGDKITSALPSNWSTALNGKVAGLSVISSGGPLNSSRISLRGDVSLNQNGNDALVVVDGVPMSSPMTNPGVAYGAGSNSELSVDYGNGFSDINPDDIESIQVLKGASATALYGTRAANGVIMVTTKSGAGAPKGIGVSYSGNFSIDDVMRWPDYQYEFGQGLPSNIGPAGSIYEGEPYYSYGKAEDGSYASTSGTSSAYGARFDANRKFYQYDPVTQGRASEATPVGKKPKATFIFDVYGEIPTTKPVFETEHYLGSDITGKWNTFIQNYTHEYDVTIGFTDSSVEILKPSIYKAVNKVNKYYKKALKKEEVSREVATSNMAHILDCANVMCFDDNSKSFEEAVKSADEPEEIIALFNQVTLRKL